MENYADNNCVHVKGMIASEIKYSHELYGEKFYQVFVSVDRLSKKTDVIDVLISDRLIDIEKLEMGSNVDIIGQFRSYNVTQNKKGKHRLKLTLFVKEIVLLEKEAFHHLNEIILNAYICKKPNYRTTPFGREITDLLVAVNRAYNKSDYLPCVVWGRNARFASKLDIGSYLQITGRIQSREYEKTLNNNEVIKLKAYEISVSSLKQIEKEEVNNKLGLH